jgi:hypothetical protein
MRNIREEFDEKGAGVRAQLEKEFRYKLATIGQKTSYQTSLIQSAARAGIFKQSMGARNQGGIGLSYRPARLHRLAKLIPWNRFLGSINV